VIGTVRRADIHQHFWPEGLLSSLARRTALPRIRNGLLELAGEAPSRVIDADHDAVARFGSAAADGLQRVIVAPSSPLGLEALPEAEELLDVFHRGVLELGPPFELWAGLASPSHVDAVLDLGAAGVCVPAGAVATQAGLHRLGPALERLAERDAPLFVHPGPAAAPDAPAWWPALNGYVAEMAAAWHAWAAWGRREHPRLRVVFAMLAGLAPLHAERLEARRGPAGAVHDQLTFFDTSSYGPRAIDAMLRAVGVDRLLYGSDRPVVAPHDLSALGPAVTHAIAVANPRRVVKELAWAS
jgi:hypothetical protein